MDDLSAEFQLFDAIEDYVARAIGPLHEEIAFLERISSRPRDTVASPHRSSMLSRKCDFRNCDAECRYLHHFAVVPPLPMATTECGSSVAMHSNLRSA